MCCDRRFAKLEATANIRECGSDLIQESYVCNTQRQIDTVVVLVLVVVSCMAVVFNISVIC